MRTLDHSPTMTANTPQVSSSKGAIAHVEDPKSEMAGQTKDTEAVESETTREDFPPIKHLGLVQSLRTYKVASLMCVLAAVGALSDGYQIQMSGSIVALKGFIRTFGDLQDDGEYKINPQYLALWGCKSAPFAFNPIRRCNTEYKY